MCFKIFVNICNNVINISVFNFLKSNVSPPINMESKICTDCVIKLIFKKFQISITCVIYFLILITFA